MKFAFIYSFIHSVFNSTINYAPNTELRKYLLSLGPHLIISTATLAILASSSISLPIFESSQFQQVCITGNHIKLELS